MGHNFSGVFFFFGFHYKFSYATEKHVISQCDKKQQEKEYVYTNKFNNTSARLSAR